MESISQILGAFGFLGIAIAILLGFLMLLVLPWLALIECARSDRDSSSRAFLIVGIVLTWGLGSLIYGLFLTRSRFLRILTVGSIVLFLVVAVPSAISFGTGMKMAATQQNERDRDAIRKIEEEFRPAVLESGALAPFQALHFAHGGISPRATTLTTFTQDGPQSTGARDVDTKIRHVTTGETDQRWFAVTKHDFGTITPSTGRFTKIEVDPTLEGFGWPIGVAFDTTAQKVVVGTSHVYTRFYRFDPRTSDWERLPVELRDLAIVGLAYDAATDSLYAFEREVAAEHAIRRIHRFASSGASLGPIALDPPIPLGRDQRGFIQLHQSGGRLVAVLPPFESGDSNQLLAIDPATGEVFGTRPTPRAAQGLASGAIDG